MAIWTLTQYQTLTAAIAEGVKTVQYSDKSVTYQSLTDMLRIKAEMEQDLGLGENGTRTGADQGRNVGSYYSGK